MHKHNNPTTSKSLYRSPSDQHDGTDTNGTYQRPPEEDHVGDEYDVLSSKYIRELAPKGDTRSIGKKICGARPCV